MLSVNNQRQTAVPLTAAPTEAKAGEAAPKGRLLAASTDTVTISGRPEKPTVKRPLSFGCAFGEDEGLTARMDPTRYPVSVHLMDVIRSSGKGYPKELEALLDNFDFYAINVGKLYTDAHPLVY